MPSREMIDKALSRLRYPPAADRIIGEGLRDATTVLAHRAANQRHIAACGIWLVDQRRVGHVEVNSHTRWFAGRLADAEGQVLAERQHRSHHVDVVVQDGRELAEVRDTWRALQCEIELATPARWSPGIWGGCRTLNHGDTVVACGRETDHWASWFRDNRQRTTAIWLHPELSLDERAVALLVLLRFLGPPYSSPD
jgi:hypothetical protein